MTYTHDIISSLIIFSVILGGKYHTRIKGPSISGKTYQGSFYIRKDVSCFFSFCGDMHHTSFRIRTCHHTSFRIETHASYVFPHLGRLSFLLTTVKLHNVQVAHVQLGHWYSHNLQFTVRIFRSLFGFTWSIQNSVFTIYFTFTMLLYCI